MYKSKRMTLVYQYLFCGIKVAFYDIYFDISTNDYETDFFKDSFLGLHTKNENLFRIFDNLVRQS